MFIKSFTAVEVVFRHYMELFIKSRWLHTAVKTSHDLYHHFQVTAGHIRAETLACFKLCKKNIALRVLCLKTTKWNHNRISLLPDCPFVCLSVYLSVCQCVKTLCSGTGRGIKLELTSYTYGFLLLLYRNQKLQKFMSHILMLALTHQTCRILPVDLESSNLPKSKVPKHKQLLIYRMRRHSVIR